MLSIGYVRLHASWKKTSFKMDYFPICIFLFANHGLRIPEFSFTVFALQIYARHSGIDLTCGRA